MKNGEQSGTDSALGPIWATRGDLAGNFQRMQMLKKLAQGLYIFLKIKIKYFQRPKPKKCNDFQIK